MVQLNLSRRNPLRKTSLGYKRIFLCFFLATSCYFSSILNINAAQPIVGHITNNTITSIGKQFYNQYRQRWPESESLTGLSVEITEIVDTNQSIVSVKINGTQVYTRRLSPGAQDIESESRKALSLTAEYLNSQSLPFS